ncbi:hypothetical protein KCP76_20025 [Salmonella enterica subsp. enterica serovar Weltevreden]|nr:hypothetical protein KCP76_20025 [Salmonella enterica subsp. enterica serovar Weltevreden]
MQERQRPSCERADSGSASAARDTLEAVVKNWRLPMAGKLRRWLRPQWRSPHRDVVVMDVWRAAGISGVCRDTPYVR